MFRPCLRRPHAITIAAWTFALSFVARPLLADKWDGWWNDDEQTVKWSGVLPPGTHNPGPDEQKQWVVNWDPVLIGYGHPSARKSDARWPSFTASDTHPARRVIIRGTIHVVSKDGKTRSPVPWLPAVRVIVSKQPDVKPDWSKPQNTTDVVWDVIEYSKKDGSFTVNFLPHELPRAVGGTHKYQVAVSLGKIEENSITWTGKDAALPVSVSQITMTGPKPLSKTQQLINGAPSLNSSHFNPVLLVRAVNHLQSLGHDRAIAELRQFLKDATDAGPHWERDASSIDTSDPECVFLIAHLLFQPVNPAEPIPKFGLGEPVPSPADKDWVHWPLFPLAVEGSVPFLLTGAYDFNGDGESPEGRVDLVSHEKIRERPIRPADNPLEAAEKLLATPHAQRLFDNKYNIACVRAQAWRAVAHLVARDDDVERTSSIYKLMDDAVWNARREKAAKLPIRWSEKKQDYVLE